MKIDSPMIGCMAAVATSPSDAIGRTLDRIAYVCLCAFIFVLPWEDTVPLIGGLVLSRWIGLLAFATTLMRVAVAPNRKKLFALHYGMLAFAGWSGLSIFWSVDWDSTLARIGTYLQLLVLAWLVWEVAATETRVLGLLQSYVFGASVCSIGAIANLMMGRSSGQVADPLATIDTFRYTIDGVNPNDLGLILALSIPMTFYLRARKTGALTALLYCLQFVLCVTVILLTGSRGAMLAAIAALVMFPLTVSKLPRWQRLASIVMCAAVIVCGVSIVPKETWTRLLNVGSEISEGTMTHRTQIWAASVEVFRDHAFLGVGSGGHMAAVANIVGEAWVAHNTFISVLVELGVIGELLLLALLAIALYCAVGMRNQERLLWVVLLATWSIGVAGATWEYRKVTWFLFSLLAAHAYARAAQKPRVGYSADRRGSQETALHAAQTSRRVRYS